MKTSIKVSRRGRVTLKIDAGNLAGIIIDAAEREGQQGCHPRRDDIEAIGRELSDWFNMWHDDASESLILQDIKDAYSKPLIDVL